MGREIRRVPKNWEHPKDENENFKPMFDEDYETAAEQWIKDFDDWRGGTHPDSEEFGKKYKYYWDWGGRPPDKEYYRPKFNSEPTHYQIYETISEGTPVGPVFETKEELIRWLIGEGHSEESATKFAEMGWAPSMIFTPQTGLKSNIHALEELGDDKLEG